MAHPDELTKVAAVQKRVSFITNHPSNSLSMQFVATLSQCILDLFGLH